MGLTSATRHVIGRGPRRQGPKAGDAGAGVVRGTAGRGGARALRLALGGPGLRLFGGALGGLLEAEAVALDGEDLGAVEEPVDEGDDAGRVGEDRGPLGEGLVGAQDDRALCLVAV